MTTERLRIQGGQFPLRIYASGVDPNSATYADLLFSGDYRSLKLLQEGSLTINAVPCHYDAGGNLIRNVAVDVGVYSDVALSKTFPNAPFFMAMGKWTTMSYYIAPYTYIDVGNGCAGSPCCSGGSGPAAVSGTNYLRLINLYGTMNLVMAYAVFDADILS